MRERGFYKSYAVKFVFFSFLFLSSFFLFNSSVFALTCTWGGLGGDSNWSNTGNWNSCGGGTPGSGDDALFNAGSAASTIDAAYTGTVNSLTINGYTGTITQARIFAINTTYTQATGTFTGGTDSITITQGFVLSGGTFTSTTGTLQVSGAWTHTAGGTFTNNGGTVVFAGNSATIDVSTTETFTNININKTSGQTLTIASGDTLVSSSTGTTTLTDGAIATGTLNAQGQVSIPGGATLFDGGSGTLLISGSTSRTVTLVGGGTYPNINVNNTASATTVNLSGAGTTVNMNGRTFTLAHASALADFSGTTAFSADTFTLTTGRLIAGSTTFTTTLMTQSTGTVTTGSGAFRVLGTGSNSYTQTGGVFNGGTTSITTGLTARFNGGTFNAPNTPGGMTSNGFSIGGSTFNGGTGSISLSGNLTINSGTFQAPSANLSVGQNFTWAGGSLTNTSNTNWSFSGSGVGLDASVNTISTITVKNLTIAKTGSVGVSLSSVASPVFIVTNAMTLTTGYLYGIGTYQVQGPFCLGTYNTGTNVCTTAATFGAMGGGISTIQLVTSVTRAVTIPAGVSIPVLNTSSTATGTTITPSGTSGTITISALSISAGTFDFSGSPVNLTVLGGSPATFSQSGGTFTAGTGTYSYSSSFSLSSSAAYTAPTGGGSTTHTGAFSITGTATYNGGDRTINMNSTFTIGGGTFTASSGNTNFASTYTHTAGGTFNANNGTATFTGGSATVNVGVSPSTSETFNNLTINKTNATTLTITSGKALIATGTTTLTNGLVSTGDLQVQGDVIVTSTYDGGTSPLIFSGSNTTQTFNLTGATALYDGPITVNKTVGTTVALSSALVMNSTSSTQNLAITSGTLSLGGNNLTVTNTTATSTFSVAAAGTFQLQGGETITLNAGNPTLSGGSTVRYVGTSGPYTLQNYSYSNLTIAGGAAVVFSLPGSLTGIATTTLTTGILSLGGSNISMTTLSNDSTFRLQGGETVTITNGMDTDSGTVEYVGNGATSYASLAAGNNYYALTFNNAAGSWTHTSTLDINNNLTITAGTLVSGGQNITIAGNWSNAGTYTSGSNTVTFDGSGAQTLTTGGTGTGQDFNNLTVNKSNTLSLVTNNLDVDGTLSVSGGTFSPGALSTTAGALTTNGGTFTGGAGAIDVNGLFTLSSGAFTSSSTTMTVSGNFDHSGGGTFTHNSGTVTLDGTDQTILGATTFNNLTKTTSSAATLTFPAGLTNTMVGTLTLTGATNAHLSLVSSTPSSQAFIDPQGSRTAQYLTVTDNNNSNVTAITCNGCTNGGNNTNWSFAASTVTWDGGGGDNNWSTAANWTSDTVPGQSDVATFNATSTKNATIDTAIDVAGILINTGYTGIITQAAAVTLGTSGYTQNTGTFTGGSQTITISGSYSLSGGTFTSTSGTLSLTGDFTNNGGTFTHNSGTVTFNGTGTQNLTTGGTGAGQTFNNLIVNKASGTLSLLINNLNVAGTLSVTLGIFSPGTFTTTAATLTVNGGTFTGGGGSVTVSGTTTVSSGTFTQSSSTVSTTNLTVNGGTFNAGTVTLTVGTKLTTSSGTFTGSSGTIDINGTASDAFTLSGGTFTSSSGNLTLAGGFDHTSGTFTHNSGTVTLDGTNQAVTGSTTFNNFTKSVTVARTLTFDAGATNVFVGTLTLTGTSGNLLSVFSNTMGMQTLFNPQGSRTAQFLNVRDNNNINVTAISCASCTNSGNNINWTFTAFVRVWDGGGGDNNWSTDANWAGDTAPTSSDVAQFDGTSTKNATIDVPIDVAGININTGYTGVITQSNTVQVGTQSFSQATGTFTGGSQSVTMTGDYTLSGGIFTSTSGTLSLAGDFNHTAGTFNANSGTVLLNGTGQSISGSTTFNNLTKNVTAADTLTLPAGATNIIGGTLTFTGTSGNLLSLVSSSPGTQTSINPQGTRSVQYLSVQDNNNINATAISCTTGCTNGGNNTNWDFAGSVTANAGPDRTIVTTTSSKVSAINLDGSGSIGTSLTYSWVITSTTGSGGVSQAGTLTNADTATPLYTAPTSAQRVTITLTVTSSGGSSSPSSDTVVMTVLDPNDVSKQISPTVVVGIMNGITIVQNTSSSGAVYLTLGSLNIILPTQNSDYSFALSSNNQIILGFPEYNNGAGEACISTGPVTTMSGFIDLNQSNPSSFVCIPGAQSGGALGQYVGVGDFDGNGVDEFAMGAPNEGTYGTIYLYSLPLGSSSPTVIATVIGGANYPAWAILTGDYLTTTTTDLSFGPNNPALNPNLAFQSGISTSAKTSQAYFLGSNSGITGTILLSLATINGATGDIIVPPPAPESAPESQPKPNSIGVLYNSQALGDVNGDGLTDLILVSSDTIYIFFGQQAVNSTIDIGSADVVITGGSAADGFGQMVITGDVTGDGINDVIVGAPYGNNNQGIIYVIFGSTQWETAMDLNTNAQVLPIYGDIPGGEIGSDLLIGDANQDGVSDIYTVLSDHRVLIISLFTPQASGGGCQIDRNNDSIHPLFIFYWLSFFIALSLLSRFLKKREIV